MYREVTMIEVWEVLRLRGEGLPKKRIAAQLGLDPKTVRRYLTAAATAGVHVTATVSDEEVRQVLLALHPAGGRPRGDGWTRCIEQRAVEHRVDDVWLQHAAVDEAKDRGVSVGQRDLELVGADARPPQVIA